MSRYIVFLGVAGLMVGCTPVDFTRPVFPAVPPEQPAKKDGLEKAKADDKTRQPINASQVSDNNARQALRDLDAGLEKDAGPRK